MKNVCKRNKKVTSSQCSLTPRLMPKAVTQCVNDSKYVKVYREAFQVIRHATEKS